MEGYEGCDVSVCTSVECFYFSAFSSLFCRSHEAKTSVSIAFPITGE